MRPDRTHQRRRVRGPVVIELRLCRGGWARGVIANESLGGFGGAFAGSDAQRLLDHAPCCVGGTVRLRFVDDPERRAVGVGLAHVTESDDGTYVGAGVSFDAAALRASREFLEDPAR